MVQSTVRSPITRRGAKRGDTGFTRDWHNCEDGYAQTAHIGSFTTNAFGLHDTLGNVWKWVADCWNESYIGASGDGSTWTQGDCARRVSRGGSWYEAPGLVRSAFRSGYPAGYRYLDLGFRLTQDI